ncbi:hypothetical protein ACFY05_41455 [Microtetraspora fusca]|uniref:RNA polymerase alpha subunit C-terminal domain-containing protein n=1 Tax=Microtetraspora fusca TaxID=1997 RepID=A0ABW6VM38_MICFU
MPDLPPAIVMALARADIHDLAGLAACTDEYVLRDVRCMGRLRLAQLKTHLVRIGKPGRRRLS